MGREGGGEGRRGGGGEGGRDGGREGGISVQRGNKVLIDLVVHIFTYTYTYTYMGGREGGR